MTDLLLVLLSIALLDSTSMIPLTVVPMALMLNGAKPFASTSAFLAGIFLAYFGGGVVVMYGLETLLKLIEPWLEGFLSAPTNLELVVQLILAIVMLSFGWKLATVRESPNARRANPALSPSGAFLLGATLTLVGLPGALPYFGAVDQILRVDAPALGSIALLAFYNMVFILPHAVLVVVRLVAPEQSGQIFKAVGEFAEKWGHRVIVLILLVIGAVLAADTIGWWLGHPVLPVFDGPPRD